jgi:hypothetical protein
MTQHQPDPGQTADLTDDELGEEDRRRSEISIGELYRRDLADPATPPPDAEVELHPPGVEGD